jgi:heterodisulfide reductase subunit C
MVAGRAWHRPAMRPARRPGDRLFAALLGVVIVTGFLLEAQKLAGPRSFYRMTGEYMMTVDPEELKPLRTHWAREFGTAFDDLPADPDPAVLAEGRQLHEDACAGCHAPARSAFVSYGMARAMGPVAGTLDAGEADKWLLYVHVFACLLGLAALPFTRFFHVLADPVSLLANAAGPAASAPAAARATRRALALDACVQCRACDLRCSVAPIARQLDNPDLLPSHKLRAVASIASGRLARRTDGRAERAAEGAFLCSDCGRCTDACPAGLDLGDLWEATRGDLDAAGLSCAAGWIQARPALAWADDLAARSGMPGLSAGATGPTDPASCPLSDDRHTFEKCVQCQTCTNVCPVVACSLDPRSAVDLTPQKVMNLLRLGLRDLALGSRMVWDCATCYQCQENCPEGVRVTDILLELRNLGYRRLATVRERRRPS